MSEKNIETHYLSDYQKSLETLEDIQLLSEFSISPLVSNAYFYLTQMKRKADAASSSPITRYDAVSSVLDEKLASIIDEFFSNKSRFKGFNYTHSTHKIELKKWNLILEIMPEVLSLLTLFNYHGTVDVSLNENRFKVSGLVLEDGNLELSRKLIYVITRKLLRAKVLLTFNIEKTARAGLFKLDLKVDISHDETLSYRVKFDTGPKEQYIISFSNIFCQYRAFLENVKAVGEHTIIEINNDLSIRHFIGLPELTRTESANKEILHFSFLFRPVSIILPMKGSLVTDAYSRSLDDEDKRKQDVSKHFRTIDFFSLFNL